ncbi:TPM domain-containing protein [Pseudobacter ginsenosidimutans]|uniref:TPM domain-containing protein n=1 Tax=Pseudobacter ginsenosidimutans TaxID=661488 RepID=A0A4Q7MXD2_9BACT|nr:TPM domain-containing protein [Pseudobacter ginsenosidimutans]RZS72759.1 uncharacterized protein EV199_4684 [Pseudobacter ginsenosidimutans]
MKRLFTIIAVLFCSLHAFAQDLDSIIENRPRQLVNDHVHALSKAERQKLEKKLVDFDNRTSTQIAVVLIPSLNGRNLEETANKLFNNWGIGQKYENNGLLILAAIKDRKIRIEVGYGLESVVTNEEAARIIKEDIGPSFKGSRYFEGLDKATNSLMELAIRSFPDTVQHASATESLQGSVPTPTSYDYATQNTHVGETNSGLGSGFRVAIVFIILIFGIAIFSAIMKNRNSGGVYSGGGYRSYDNTRSAGTSLFGGLFAGWLLHQWFSNSNKTDNNDNNAGSWNTGSSNDYSSGSSDFGGFDGGSSGGDSGGDSGGGGSSGDW